MTTASGRRAILLRALGGLALLVCTIACVGCRGGAQRLGTEESPRVRTGTEVVIESDDPSTIEIDPRALIDREIEAVIVTAYDESGAVARSWELPGDLRFDLPVDGLEDARTYRYEIALRIANVEYPLAQPLTVSIALGLPELRPRYPLLVTINPTPLIAWEPVLDEVSSALIDRVRIRIVVEGSDEDVVEEIAADRTEYRPERFIVDTEAIRRTTSVRWTVRAVSASGVLGPTSVPAQLLYDPSQAAPSAITGAGGATVVERPVLTWSEVDGALVYHFELTAGDSGEALTATLESSRYPLDIDVIEGMFREGDRRILRWRVAAEGLDGIVTARSRTYTVRYQSLMPAFFAVLPSDDGAELTLGLPSEAGLRAVSGSETDERPQATVELRRPFAMARYELSNEIVAQVLSAALERELVYEEAERIVDSSDGRVLVGLGALEFGSQYGLEAVRDAEGGLVAVRARAGYSSHPAVGVSWYGAVHLANALSLLAGRAPVYVVAPDGVEAYPDRNGYRLPSEAEWAFAAALTAEPAVGSPVGATENRALGALEVRSANYQRSGDRWEALVSPYTAAGGPTTPVGALGIANPIGVNDLIGNVWEWCWDWYDPRWYERAEGLSDPVGPEEATPDTYGRLLRVVRGGAWNTPREDLRISNRGAFGPETGSHSIGVRLVYTIE